MGQAWKQLERDAAAALGGRRNVEKGLGGPDVVDVPGWLCECKYRDTLAVDTLYRQERQKRRADLRRGRKFCLVVRAQGQRPLAVVDLADFADLVTGRNGPQGE
jgi:hypothetical protein